MLTETRPQTSAACCPATVVRLDSDQMHLWIRRNDDAFAEPESARLALAGVAVPDVGDQVLIAGNAVDGLFVIGLLQREHKPQPRRLELGCGTRAEVKQNAGEQSLRVLSAAGELMFEYEAATKTTRVYLTPGNVQFIGQQGDMEFLAGGAIRFHSQQVVDVTGDQGVCLQAGDCAQHLHSSLMLGTQNAGLRSRMLKVAAEDLDVQAVETRLTATNIVGRALRTRLISERVEMVLGTVVQRAKQFFCKVSGLHELHARNARSLVEEASHLTAGRVNMKAERQVKIDGQQIHLG